MPPKNQLEEIKRKIMPVLKRHDVIKAGIFGSFARGEATKKSDVDIIVKFRGKKPFWTFQGLRSSLNQRFQGKWMS